MNRTEIARKHRKKIQKEPFIFTDTQGNIFTVLEGERQRVKRARVGELMAIKRADINLSTKPFSVKLRSKGQDVKVEVRPNHVLIPKSKNGKPRAIPLSNVAKDISRTFSAMKQGWTTCSQILTPAGRTRMLVRRSRRHAGKLEFRI